MNDEEELLRAINDHEKRLLRLESLLLKVKPRAVVAKKRSLNDVIIDLRDKGFFSQPKTALETHTKLNQEYPCDKNRVEVALFRLSGSRQLRLTTKSVEGKRLKAYAWSQ